MIPPAKRKDLSITLVVCADLRQHLLELSESGALGADVRSVSDTLRVLLTKILVRMEAGEALADSPYERVPNKLGVRLSFRHDEEFSERIGALWARDGGGRGSRSVTAFWVELLGRAVALAREGALETPACERVEPVPVAPGAAGQADAVAAPTPFDPDPRFVPAFVTPEQWEELQRQFAEAVRARPPAGPPVRRAPPTLASDPEGVAALASLVRAYRAILAGVAGRPLPDEKAGPDGSLEGLMGEVEKLLREATAPEGKGRKRKS